MLLNNVSLIYIVSSLISIILSVYAFNKNQKPVSTALSLLLGGISIWSLFYGIEIAATDINLIRFCLDFEYIGISTIPVIWFLYAAHYTRADSWLTLPVKLTLFVVPAITLLMVITNYHHHLFYTNSDLGFSNNWWFHKMEPGPFYWVHIIYSYVAVIAGVLLFTRMYFKVSKENKFHIGIILTSVLIPYFISFAYISGFKPLGFLDMTPVGFLIMGVILLFGALGNNLFDVTPLALSTLFDSIPDAIFVYDKNFELIDSNPSAKLIIDKHLKNNQEKFKVLTESYKNLCIDSSGYVQIEFDDSIYKATCKCIYDKKRRITGNMIIFSDITVAKKTELKLIESEEQHRLLFETAQEAIIVVQGSKLVYFNPVFEQMTGYSKEEIPTIDFVDFAYTADKFVIENNYNITISGKAEEKNCQLRIQRKDEQICWVNMSSEKLMWDGKPATLNFLSDITDQKRISEFQLRLMSIADTFINTPYALLNQTIQKSLCDMGLFVGADRAYIFDYDWKNEICVNTYEWCAVGISPEIDNLQAVPLAIIPDWIETHKRNESLFIRNVLELPENDMVRQVLEPQDIKSLFAIPLIDNNFCVGFVGFDFVLKLHEYSEKEKSLLHLFAQMLVNVLNRKAANEIIAEQIDTQKLITEISKDFISADSTNIDFKINSILQRVGCFFKVDRTYILRYSDDGWNESNTNEWCADEIKPQIDTIKNINISVYPWWKKQMDYMQVINIPDVLELPNEALNEKLEFQRQDIKSILCVPVINNNKVIGFLGFDAVAAKVTWTDEQISIIQTLANIIGDALIKVTSEMELRKSIKLAEAASIAKSDFLSNMSHEIRTPLNGVIGFTDLLRNTNLDKIQLDYLDNAITSANSLLGVISDILDFSKIEAGKLELDLLKSDILELVENTADMMNPQATKKSIELLLNVLPNVPKYAYIDQVRLKQIIVNLLSNAIKFTHSGEVELKLSFERVNDKSGHFIFQVRDTGIGVKEEDKDKLFKAFSQADTSATRRYGGTGLGLIISNSLVQKMGGQIKFESEYEKGSCFTFSILTDYKVDETVIKYPFANIRNVLIVDDNKSLRLILEQTFSYWNISNQSVGSGLEAIGLLENSHKFDLLLVDYQMPELNGLETIKYIREKDLSESQEQSIILLNNNLDKVQMLENAKKYDIQYFLSKPVKLSDMTECLSYLSRNSNVDKVRKVVKYDIDQDMPQILSFNVKIIVAEDTNMNMLVIHRMLKNFIPNVELFEAKNGEEVLVLLDKVVPDLILMDVQMPVMDGIAATKKIKLSLNPAIKNIPIIALTAGVSNEERDNCYKAGMIDFLSKPIDKKTLHEKVFPILMLTFAPIHELGENPQIDVLANRHFDKDALSQKIGNNNDLYLTLINLAKEEYPMYFDKLKIAIAERDLRELKSTAHSLKGSAYNMEFRQLADLTQEIELNIDNSDELRSILNKVLVEWNKVLSLL